MREIRLFAHVGFAVVLMASQVRGYCSSDVIAHVLAVGTYGNGNVYVALDQSIDEPGCSMAYIELPANGLENKAVLAAASLAIATGATIRVKTDTCYNGTPSFSGARSAYLVLNKP